MEIGFAKRDISPPVLPEGELSIPMLGFRWERAKAYREVHDPLYARAVAIRSGDDTGIIFACDLFGDAVGFCERSAAEIQDRFGVPAQQVFFSCTHVHPSPDTLGICRREVAGWWIDLLVGQLVETAGEAIDALRPGSLCWSEILCPGPAYNRRTRITGPWEEEHGPLGPVVLARNTAVDETLRILWASDTDGSPFGAILNFACHPVILQTMPMISADYCGPAAGQVEEELSADAVCLYINGPSGDINPVCNNSMDYADCEKVGGEIASKALEAIRAEEGATPIQGGPIAGRLGSATVRRQRLVDLPGLRARERQLLGECEAAEAAGRIPRDSSHPLQHLVLAQERLEVENMPLERGAPLHALRIGEAVFLSFPGELLTALGQDVRRGIGGKTMLAQCARAHLGYICPREVFAVGGYETGPGTWSWLAKGEGEVIAAAAARLARGLAIG